MAVDILIIGAGGVGSVVAHKCAQASLNGAFGHITLASRTESRCRKIAESIRQRYGVEISTAKVDADNVPELCQQTLHGDEHCPALSGSAHHGRLP